MNIGKKVVSATILGFGCNFEAEADKSGFRLLTQKKIKNSRRRFGVFINS